MDETTQPPSVLPPSPLQPQQDEAPSLFSKINDGLSPELKQSPNTPEQNAQTGFLAAMAMDQHLTDDPNDLGETADHYTSLISNGREDEVRQQVGIKTKDDLIAHIQQAQQDLLKTPITDTNQGPKLSDLIHLEVDTRKSPSDPHSIEFNGVKNIQEAGVRHDQQAMEIDNTVPTIWDEISLQTYKLSRFQKELDAIHKQSQQDGVVHTVYDFLKALVFLPKLTAEARVGQGPLWQRLLNPGKGIQQTIQMMMGQSKEDFDATLPQFVNNLSQGYFSFAGDAKSAEEIMSRVPGFNGTDVLETNLEAWKDEAFAALPIIGKMAKGPIKIAAVVGNRRDAVTMAASRLRAEATGTTRNTISGTDAVDAVLPSVVKVDPNVNVSISGDVVSMLDGVDEVANRVSDMERVTRITAEQLGKRTEQAQQDILNRLRGNYRIVDVGQAVRNEDTKLFQTSITLGNPMAEGGFVTKAGAERELERLGLDPKDATIVQLRDQQHYIKLSADIPENGITIKAVKENEVPNTISPNKWLPGMMDRYFPKFFNSRRFQAVLQQTRITKEVYEPLAKQIMKLNKNQQTRVSQVMDEGQKVINSESGVPGHWWTPQEFVTKYHEMFNELPSDKEIIAYHAARRMNDVSHYILNAELHINRARAGILTVSAKNESHAFDTGRVNGTVLDKLDPSLDIFDLDEGAKYSNGVLPEKPLSYEERLRLETKGVLKKQKNRSYEDAQAQATGRLKDKWDTGNYRLIKLESHIDGPDGTPIKYILAHKADSTVGPLERNQLPYRGGGAFNYDATHFLKQVQTRTINGKDYLFNTKAFMADVGPAELQKEGDAMNEAIAKWRTWYEKSNGKFPPKDVIEAIEKTQFRTVAKWRQALEENEFNLEHRFEVLGDREESPLITKLGQSNRYIRVDDDNWNSLDQYLHTKGRLYYSKRGTTLLDPDLTRAKTISAFSSVIKAAKYAINTFSYADYNKAAIEEWARLAEPYLVPGNHTAMDMFRHGVFNSAIKDARNPKVQFYNTLEQMRQRHLQFMNMTTPEVTAKWVLSTQLARGIEKLGLENTKGVTGIYKKLLDKNSNDVQRAVRGMIFDPMMGFYDYGQVWMQAQTAMAAASIEPKFAAQAAANSKTISHMLWNRSEDLVDFYANVNKDLHGFENPDEFKMYIEAMKNHGIMNVGGEMLQSEHELGTISGSAAIKTLKGVRDNGRIFFELGNKVNRLTASQIAWQVVKRDFPHLEVGGERFIEEFLDQVNKLDFNMTKASAATWQHGWVGSTIGRMQTYNARMLEAMMSFGKKGGSFSAAQRARLIAGQSLMYGAKGMLGVRGAGGLMEGINYGYKAATGQDMPEPIRMGLTKGLWDTIYGMGGADTDFSTRAAVPSSFLDMIHRFFGGELEAPAEFAAGPIATWGNTLYNMTSNIMSFIGSTQSGVLTPQEFKLVAWDLSQMLNSTKRATQAYWAYHTGLVMNPKTDTEMYPSNILTDIMISAGIPLGHSEELYDISQDKRAREEVINDMAQKYALSLRETLRAMGAMNPEERNEQTEKFWRLKAIGLMQSVHNDPMLKNEIQRRADEIVREAMEPALDRALRTWQNETGTPYERKR